MKIYTKTGDGGATALGNGERVSKAHPRVEAYGAIDELNAHLGLLRSQGIGERHLSVLLSVQEMLMRYSATVACCKGYEMREDDVAMLEREIDALQQALPPQKYFIIPGGSAAAAQCHVARCVCRRAERLMVKVAETSGSLSPILLPLLNRLSDYLFVLSRSIHAEEQVGEQLWNPSHKKF
ncbi:MAG: cob(I)yrinic acid a,c-diamide adenosyltransferase [Prevotellaceae bacterium]|jgi:cob(I)alamin adenosyltransferase|nr:cob(I)yrinic acid a,c-diamide adenosyltransferase [Prevotellaceae bacterium]